MNLKRISKMEKKQKLKSGRKPLSETEKTVTYPIKMLESLHRALKNIHNDKIRYVLTKLAQSEQKKEVGKD